MNWIKQLFGKPKLVKATVWNRESLRSALLAGQDKLRNSLAWRWLNDQEKQLSVCGRQFWSTSNNTTNAALDAFVSILNVQVPYGQETPYTMKVEENYDE